MPEKKREQGKVKCECPTRGQAQPNMEGWYSEEEKIGMNHEPNECKCKADLKLYSRGDKKLWLCSCCNLPGDKEVQMPEETSSDVGGTEKTIAYPIFCKLCDAKIENEEQMHFHMIYAHDVTRTKILDLIEEFMKNG